MTFIAKTGDLDNEATPDNTNYAIYYDNSTINAGSYTIRAFFEQSLGNDDHNVTEDVELEPGKWYHIAMVYQSTLNTLWLYRDGVMVNSTVITPISPNQNTKPVVIGSSHTSSLGNQEVRFNGSIDEVRIWNIYLPTGYINQSTMMNLKKINESDWVLYVNQSGNLTTGLTEGQYKYKAWVSDYSGHENRTSMRTFTINSTDPSISSVSDKPGSTGYGNNVTIKATVTDALSAVDKVTIGVTPQGGDEINYTTANEAMSSAGTTYTLYFNRTWVNGTYDYEIYANDSLGNSGSSTGSFVVRSALVLNVQTTKKYFGAGQKVNITDPQSFDFGEERFYRTSYSENINVDRPIVYIS
jgi:hypothetical protein